MSYTTEQFKKQPIHHQLIQIFPRKLCSKIWTASFEPELSLCLGKVTLNPVSLSAAILNYHEEDENAYILDVIFKHYGQEKLILFGISQQIEEIVKNYLEQKFQQKL